MPTAKARYDIDGSWKCRQFSVKEWDKIKEDTKQKLSGIHPFTQAEVNILLDKAHNAIETEEWNNKRLTNEELRTELDDILSKLIKAKECLSNMSQDLKPMLGADADYSDCCDKISELIPHFQSAKVQIRNLPRAKKIKDTQHAAAIEMTICVLHILKDRNISLAATYDPGKKNHSIAVKILKIIGDALGLHLDESTWKDNILEGRKRTPSL